MEADAGSFQKAPNKLLRGNEVPQNWSNMLNYCKKNFNGGMSDAWLNFQDGEFYVASGGVA